MLYPFEKMEESTLLYLPRVKAPAQAMYLLLLTGITGALASLPFLYIDISVKAMGIIRPVMERTEVRPLVSGIIDSLFYKEGDRVEKDALLFRIKDPVSPGKKFLNQFETRQREAFIQDLVILTTSDTLTVNNLTEMASPLYREQASRYIHQQTNQDASLRKANKELELNSILFREKVISSKEFFDIQINQEKMLAAYRAFRQEQLGSWQQELARYRLELSQYQQQLQQVTSESHYYEVRAPVSGIIQGIQTRYAGGSVQQNEMICTLSPEETLVGECLVPAKDIGLLHCGQEVRFQIEAFPYHYFGMLSGRVLSIDNDYTPVDNKPVFKLRCSFDEKQLKLKNGFTGLLKKGLGFQANFKVARRSLWQLLFDKLDNWLNPNAPMQTNASNP